MFKIIFISLIIIIVHAELQWKYVTEEVYRSEQNKIFNASIVLNITSSFEFGTYDEAECHNVNLNFSLKNEYNDIYICDVAAPYETKFVCLGSCSIPLNNRTECSMLSIKVNSLGLSIMNYTISFSAVKKYLTCEDNNDVKAESNSIYVILSIIGAVNLLLMILCGWAFLFRFKICCCRESIQDSQFECCPTVRDEYVAINQ